MGFIIKKRRPMDKTGIRSGRGCIYHHKFYVFVFFCMLTLYFLFFFYRYFFFTNCFCFFVFENFCFSCVSLSVWHKPISIIALLLIILSFLEKYGLMQSQQCVSLCHVCISAYQSTFLHVLSSFKMFRDISRFFEIFWDFLSDLGCSGKSFPLTSICSIEIFQDISRYFEIVWDISINFEFFWDFLGLWFIFFLY